MSNPQKPPGLATLCARPVDLPPSTTKPLAPALELSTVYRVESLAAIDRLYAGQDAGFTYARDGHPGAAQLATKLADLEGAERAFVGPSGMAVEAAILLALLKAGDVVALAEGLYGKTTKLVASELARWGLQTRRFDPTDLESARAAIQGGAKLVLLETISNPLVRVAEIEGIVRHARQSGALMVVDHTFAPLLCRPLELGADLVVHSATKVISGHGDATLGVVAGRRDLIDRIAGAASIYGYAVSPLDCWLTLRGVATLYLRMERSCATALELAKRLAGHRRMRLVHYPGLASHPDHLRAIRMFVRGFGTIVTIDVGGRPQAEALIQGLKHIPFAPSLGDVSTMVSHPATTSHRGQSPEDWKRQGIHPGLVRISVGLEDPDDLWDEFATALHGMPPLT